MLDINLRIDSMGYSEKPTKDEAAVINSRLSKTKCISVNFNDFCFLVGSKGHSFCISDFYGKRKKKVRIFCLLAKTITIIFLILKIPKLYRSSHK